MIRVLVVDDDALVRTGLRLILSSSPDLDVVGEAADGADVVPAAQAHRPDVVLMDLHMPRVDGVAATAALRALRHPPQVLVLTSFDADRDVLRALEAGAAGFLLKDTPPREIVDGVCAVARGESVLSPRVARYVVDAVAANGTHQAAADARGRLGTLSERELDVARLVAHGLSNPEIGGRLYCSETTVKTHLSRAMTKLGLTNRVQLALLVERAGARV